VAGLTGAWLVAIVIVVGFGPVGVDGPVGKFGSGNLPVFP